MIYTIYRHTCVVNGKSYIGFTSKTMEIRWAEHVKKAKAKRLMGKSRFHNAIVKYGEEAFTHDVLAVSMSREDALVLEKALIDQYQTRNHLLGYNMTAGGMGGGVKGHKMTDDQKKKISEALCGREFSDEHRSAISRNHHDVSGENNPFFGRKHSDETKEKIANREYIRGDRHHFYGKRIGTSFKEGKDHPRSQSIVIDGVEYDSLTLASKALGIARSTLKRRYLS